MVKWKRQSRLPGLARHRAPHHISWHAETVAKVFGEQCRLFIEGLARWPGSSLVTLSKPLGEVQRHFRLGFFFALPVMRCSARIISLAERYGP
jgi:hypothetical protein